MSLRYGAESTETERSWWLEYEQELLRDYVNNIRGVR